MKGYEYGWNVLWQCLRQAYAVPELRNFGLATPHPSVVARGKYPRLKFHRTLPGPVWSTVGVEAEWDSPEGYLDYDDPNMTFSAYCAAECWFVDTRERRRLSAAFILTRRYVPGDELLRIIGDRLTRGAQLMLAIDHEFLILNGKEDVFEWAGPNTP